MVPAAPSVAKSSAAMVLTRQALSSFNLFHNYQKNFVVSNVISKIDGTLSFDHSLCESRSIEFPGEVVNNYG